MESVPQTAYPQSIVVDCNEIDSICHTELERHGMFLHRERVFGARRSSACTHTFNELFMSIHKRVKVYGYLTEAHIAAWCALLRSVSRQNPQCPEIAVYFSCPERNELRYGFMYDRDSDKVDFRT